MNRGTKRLSKLLWLLLLLPQPAFADETISSGLTLVIPSQGQTNWGTLFKDDFATPISEHQHTGSPDGLQMVTGSYTASSVTGGEFRLDNDEYLRARNNANSADIDVLKVDTSDKVTITPSLYLTASLRLDNNTIWCEKAAANCFLGNSTSDASDDRVTTIASGGSAQVTRGAFISLSGNEAAAAGDATIAGGDAAGSDLFLQTNGTTGLTLMYQGTTRLRSFTNAQRASLTPAAGDVIYNSDDGNLNIYDGTNWILPDGTTT